MGSTEPGALDPCLFLSRNGDGLQIPISIPKDMGSTAPGALDPCLFLSRNGDGLQIPISIPA